MTDRSTIFGISSGSGIAGIAVIRVSGPTASDCVLSLCGSLPKPRYATLFRLIHPEDDTPIDEALVLWFPAPASFTGEDVAEFHVHGGQAVLSCLMEVLGRLDKCRLAEPGEFTRRAFLNGRMDLVAVDGLADLLAAKTDAQRRQAWFVKDGGASAIYDDWRDAIVAILARVEAVIDFTDQDGIEEGVLADMADLLSGLQAEMLRRLDDENRGEKLRDGLSVVLAGAPNVGKSSLLNALAQRDAVIVSAEPGTTRDVVSVELEMSGVPVVVSDTAGLRSEACGSIEQEGIRRARAQTALADIVLWVSAPDVASGVQERFDSEAFRILNKSDMANQGTCFQDYDFVVSAKTGEGLGALVKALETMVGEMFSVREPAIITRQRHRDAVPGCLHHVRQALDGLGKPLELTAEELRLASYELARLTGRIDVEDLLDVIFHEFCIGK